MRNALVAEMEKACNSWDGDAHGVGGLIFYSYA